MKTTIGSNLGVSTALLTPIAVAAGVASALFAPAIPAMMPNTGNMPLREMKYSELSTSPITSSEPGNGLGDGNTSLDIQDASLGTDDRSQFGESS